MNDRLLCRMHEDRLASIDATLLKQTEKIGKLAGGVDALCTHLLPPRKRPDSHPPGTVSLKTKWGTVKGSAPWIALLATLSAAVWVVERFVN